MTLPLGTVKSPIPITLAGSIPDYVIGIFHWHNPSGRTVALGLTQPLTEMSTRNISWGGRGDRCIRLTTLPPSCADYLEIWEPQTPAPLWGCPDLYRDCFTFFTNYPISFNFVSCTATILIFYFPNLSFSWPKAPVLNTHSILQVTRCSSGVHKSHVPSRHGQYIMCDVA